MIGAGIIVEYNPFHKGHQYQIEQVRKRTGADCVVVAMSGDFVQRGAPAMVDKYTRTRMALAGGADFVLELPVLFATSSSEDFARAGVDLFSKLGGVDYLCFGSEVGELEPLKETATLLAKESEAFSSIIKAEVTSGKSYPMARNQALSMFLPYPPEIWTSPNNLLAIEYLKALHYLDSKLEPLTIKREGSFHSKEMDTSFASASAIRETLLKTKSPKEVEVGQQIPKESLPYLSDTLMEWEDFYDFLSLKIVENWPQLTQYTDVSEELARRIQKIFNECCSMAELSEKLKTKQYTYTRIQRSLLHILLGITKEMSSEYKNAGYMPYARVLGFKKEKADFFKELKQKSQIPLVTKMTAFTHPLLELEIKASSLYELAVKNKYQCRNRKNEYNQGVIIF